MIRATLSFVLLMLLALASPFSLAVASDPEDADLDTIREAWESIETLHFVSEEVYQNEAGEIGPTLIYDYKLGEGNRRAIQFTMTNMTVPQPTLTELVEFVKERPSDLKKFVDQLEQRRRSYALEIEDGASFYSIKLNSEDRNDILQVMSRDQQNTRGNRVEGISCVALWQWTPVGRPLLEHLNAGATLQMDRGEDGSETVVLVTQGRFDSTVRCELDPEHDYLPRRIEITRGPLGDQQAEYEYETTEFRRDGGRWFPARGKMIHPRFKWSVITFTLTELHVNQPIPEDTFELPRVPITARVADDRRRNP